MAEPIEFQIVQNVQAVLQAISVANGYFYDVRGTGVKLNPDYDVEALVAEDAARPWITLEVTPEGWTFQPSNRVTLEMPMRVHWFNDDDQCSDEDLLRMCYRAYSDIEKAVSADHSRGGLAVDTRIVTRFAAFQGSAVWVAVDLAVKVIRTYGEASA